MDELNGELADAEGFLDVEQNSTGKHPNKVCLNCGVPLRDIFCHHCGQKDIPKRQTLRELWTNFISSFWSYEGKFFLTTRYLITKPGFLAIEYNKGKRESYYHPARMYVFISFIFFLLFFSFANPDRGSEDDTKSSSSDSIKAQLTKAKRDSVLRTITGVADSNQENRKKDNFGTLTHKTIAEYDSIEKLKPESERDGWLKRIITTKLIELKARYNGDLRKFGKDFSKAFMDNFSKVLFYLLPVFALLLKLLYLRKDYFYSEHLVFSIYFYNFFYLAGSLHLLVNQVTQLNWLGNVIGLWIMLYLLFAMKRMYQQGWGKTIVKYLMFAFVFLICASIGFAINAIAILMSI